MTTGRGRWDRRVPGEARRVSQRRKILEAVGRVAAEQGEVTVGEVVTAAGIGRNTFYEHFDDARAAVEALEREGLARLRALLDARMEDARTPVEQLRALSAGWVEVVRDSACSALFRAHAGGPDRATARGELEERLRAVLLEARAAGTVARVPEAIRVTCLAGAFDAVADRIVSDDAVDAKAAAEALVDVTLRAFR
jgi:AcrR family transcriptional regulator